MYTFSEEHKIFLNKRKKKKIFISAMQILIILTFLIIWEVLAKNNLINTFLFSSPSRIINTIVSLYLDGQLFRHIGITLYEVLISFFIATGIGTFIATILWSNKVLAKIVDPYLTILNSLPKVALGPLIIIWVGASINSIIFMALTISTFVTILNIYNSFISVNENYLIMLKSFGASKWQIFKKVVFPSNYENIISALKINVSMSLIGVIMGELLVSKSGIGYLIMYGSQIFNIDLVISSVFILGIISYLMYLIIDKFETKLKNKRD